MKRSLCLLMLLLGSIAANAQTNFDKYTYETVTQTAVPFEPNTYVQLVDQNYDCHFYGSTKVVDVNAKGLIHKLANEKRYQLEINKLMCGQEVRNIKPITIGLNRPLEAGEKMAAFKIEYRED